MRRSSCRGYRIVHKSSVVTCIYLYLLLIEMSNRQKVTGIFMDDQFIINLVNQESFDQYSLVILQDRFDNSESVDSILYGAAMSSYPKSAYSIKYTHHIENSNAQLNVSSTAVISAQNKTEDWKLFGFTKKFKLSIAANRRKSDPCQIVILMMNDIRSEFVTQVFNLLTPVYLPITRKDEDFYIFKTDVNKHERLLMMRELPSRTKFKIAVGVENNVVKVNTICFFCIPGGFPKFMEHPVTEQNLPLENFNYFPDFVWNLNGKLLYVAFPYIRAKIEADPPWEGTSNARRGNWKQLFERFLTVSFNFTYNMFVATGKDGNKGGGGTGVQLKNGTWIGVTGDLISGKADLGIVIANTPKRILYIDFTNSFYDIGCLTFVTAQPSRIYSPLALLWPFDWVMWGCIGLSTVLSIMFFSAAFKIMQAFQFGSGENWTLSEQIQFFLSTFLEQDSPVHPESSSMRSFVALWFLYTMILTTVYRSKMTTLLAFPVLGKLPITFEELTFSDYQVGFMRHGDSAYNTLAASTDPVYVKLVKEMEIIRGFGLECLEKVVNFKYGCIGYDFAMVHLRERNLSESETHKLVFAPARTYNIWLGLGTEGKSIYRLNFGKVLSWTRQFHLADIWDEWDMYHNVRLEKLKWWKETGQLDKTKRMEEESDDLTMKHIAGAFYVLIGCLIISCCGFIHEIVTFYKGTFYSHFALRYWSAVKRLGRKKQPAWEDLPLDQYLR